MSEIHYMVVKSFEFNCLIANFFHSKQNIIINVLMICVYVESIKICENAGNSGCKDFVILFSGEMVKKSAKNKGS